MLTAAARMLRTPAWCPEHARRMLASGKKDAFSVGASGEVSGFVMLGGSERQLFTIFRKQVA